MTATRQRRLTATLVLWLACAWILTGALFKLLKGSPNDLPPVLREIPISMSTLFPLVIAIELAVVTFALLRPRLGWFPVVLQYLAFLGVLGWLLARGAESCGCFGSNVKLAPELMAGIDGTLLLLLLATRPWSALSGAGAGPGAPLPLAGLLAIGVASLPFLISREIKAPPPGPGEGNLALGAISAPAQGAQVPAGGTLPAGAQPVEAAPKGPIKSQGFVLLSPEDWVGQTVFDTPLAGWLPLEDLPGDGLWVFYRITCDHCRDHLLKLMSQEQGQRPLVLVRIREAADYSMDHVVEMLPQGGHVFQAELPEGYDWAITTPAEMELSGYTVTRGEQGLSD